MNLSQLAEQNTWWQSPERIIADPNIVALTKLNYVWKPKILTSFDFTQDFLYVLKGPRQVGKTTLLKTLAQKLLNEGTFHQNIFYFSCNLIETYLDLVDVLNLYLNWIRSKNDQRIIILLDEISFVKNWQRAIKHFSDLGKFSNATLILTGSHAVDIKKSSERLPGRRGEGTDLDKFLLPMTFQDYLATVEPALAEQLKLTNPFDVNISKFLDFSIHQQKIDTHFLNYLLTGGFPLSVNAFNTEKTIPNWIYNIYLQWIIGDLSKLGKQEHYFKQIARKLIESFTTPVSWQTICKSTDISSHNTVFDYIDHLESSFILFIVYCLDMNTRLAAYRKNKKLYFSDPFIFHTIHAWIKDSQTPFQLAEGQVFKTISLSKLIENVVGLHLARYFSRLFYWHNRKEIDFVVIQEDRLLPIEVKFQQEINNRDLAYLKTFPKAIVVTRSELKYVENIFFIPASLFCLISGE